MIAILYWKDNSEPSEIQHVELVQEIRGGILLKTFGNNPIAHRYPVLKHYAVVQDGFVDPKEIGTSS